MNGLYRSVLVIVLMLQMVIALGGCGSNSAPVVTENALMVDTAEVQIMNISKYASFSGRVKGSNETSIIPKVSSRVVAVHVEPGQQVKAGQLLFTLDGSDIESSVKQAQAGLASAKAAQTSSEIQLESARRNLERIQILHEAGVATNKELEAAQDQYESLRSGTVEASVAQVEAALAALEQQMKNYQITSPIDGVVGRIDVSVGDVTSQQTPVAAVNNTGELIVEIMVGESDISFVEPGSDVEVVINAIGSDPITGLVKNVATISRAGSHSYPVTITLPNVEGRIKSGMFADIKIATLKKHDVLGIPLIAVIPEEGRSSVYIVTDESRACEVQVEIGITDGKYVEIVEGLEKDQRVVTKGNTLINQDTLLKTDDGGTA